MMGRPRKIDDDLIAEYTLAGYTGTQIAEMIGYSTSSVYRSRARTGFRRHSGSPPVDDNRVRELTLAGFSSPKIATILGCTPRSVQRSRVRAGIAKGPGKRFTPEEIEWAEKLLAEGCSRQEVERTLGGSLRHRFPDRCWDRQQIAQFGALCRRLNNAL